jgi:hypothetical protein
MMLDHTIAASLHQTVQWSRRAAPMPGIAPAAKTSSSASPSVV